MDEGHIVEGVEKQLRELPDLESLGPGLMAFGDVKLFLLHDLASCWPGVLLAFRAVEGGTLAAPRGGMTVVGAVTLR